MNDWMQQEVLRQAVESGDPAAQTGSWALPAQSRLDSQLLFGLGLVALIAVVAVLVSSAFL